MKQGREGNGGRDSRLLRAFVRLFPRAFREQFGDDVLRTLLAAHRAASAAGVRGRVTFWLRNVPDLIAGAVRERIGSAPRRTKGRDRKMTMNSLLQDIRYTARRFARTPMFAVATVSTLAIAIGANVAVFSVVNGVLLEPLPFEEPGRLVSLGYTAPGLNFEQVNHAAALHFTYLDESRAFESVGMWRSTFASVAGREAPEEVEAMLVTHTTLPLLRVRAAVGRTFSEQDGAPDAPLTIILGNGYWQSRFGGDPDIVGQTLTVDGQVGEIIGVMPADLPFLDHDPAIYLPFRIGPEDLALWALDYQGVARLRPGVTIQQANADVERMIPLAVERFPGPITQATLERARFEPRLQSLKRDVVGDIGNILWVLLGTVGIVLVIACANVANLFLARTNERQTEVAVRKALGASRGTLARQALTEGLMLGLLGGLGGLALAHEGVDLLRWSAPAGLPRVQEIGIRPLVLLFTFGLSTAVGLVFGLMPFLSRGGDLGTTLKEGGGQRGGAGMGQTRVRDTLVAAQVALALVLLVGAGLMIRSMLALSDVHQGFERPDEVLTARVTIPSSAISEPEGVALAYEQMQASLEAIPGVVSVGASTSIAMDGFVTAEASLVVEGAPLPEGQIPPVRRHQWVLPGYFETIENPVRAGRSISWADVHARAPVAVITENLAIEHWGSAADAIGKRIRPGAPPDSDDEPPWREIIGVVGDIRHDGPMEEPVATVYWPIINRQHFGQELMVARSMAFAIRTPRIRTAGFVDEVQSAIWAVNAHLPLANVQTLQQIVRRSMARTSFALVMLMIASAAALLLGAVGIYGVTSYAVAQRRHELGVRVALGAQRGHISGLLLRRALVLASLGAATGVAIALGLTRLMSTLLYGVSAVDPLTFTVMTIFVGGMAMLATWIPARRAARVNPMTALRME